MIKILLIGKNGQLGQETERQAKEFDYFIKSYGHDELNVQDTDSVDKKITAIKPDILINASAFHVVDRCEIEPQNAFAVNAIAVKDLAVLCIKRKVKFVTFSTDYVFNGLKGSPYKETDQPHPVQMYGLSKLAGEVACLAYNEEAVVIRSCGVYGGLQGSRSKGGNFILNILKEAGKKKVLEVSSEQIVSPTYAVDLAKATLELVSNKSISGIYHLVNEGYCSWAQLAAQVMNEKALDVKIIPVDRKGGSQELKRPIFSALLNTRAAKLGIVLPSWQDAVRRYINTIH